MNTIVTQHASETILCKYRNIVDCPFPISIIPLMSLVSDDNVLVFPVDCGSGQTHFSNRRRDGKKRQRVSLLLSRGHRSEKHTQVLGAEKDPMLLVISCDRSVSLNPHTKSVSSLLVVQARAIHENHSTPSSSDKCMCVVNTQELSLSFSCFPT